MGKLKVGKGIAAICGQEPSQMVQIAMNIDVQHERAEAIFTHHRVIAD